MINLLIFSNVGVNLLFNISEKKFFQKFRPVPAVPCFPVENTGQSRPGCVSVNTGHWFVPSRLSCVFNGKTRDSRDGTNQCSVFTDARPGQDCPVFSTRIHGTDGTIECPLFSDTQPGRDI